VESPNPRLSFPTNLRNKQPYVLVYTLIILWCSFASNGSISLECNIFFDVVRIWLHLCVETTCMVMKNMHRYMYVLHL